jgi:2-methylcitrate dehydratase PrpD
MSGLAAYLGDACDRLSLDDVPPTVVAAAKRSLLDTLAVAVAGRATRVGTLAARLAESEDSAGGPPATIWAGASSAARAAAFANAGAAHALDMDDTCFAGVMHGSAVILPAVLARAEARESEGATLLEAYIAGSEVAYALGAGVGPRLYDRGWWPTGLLAGIGAAAGLAKLEGCAGEEIARAIAFAALGASGFRAVAGSDAKPLGVGMAAARAFDALSLARSEATAPLDVFERREGPLALSVGDNVDLEAVRAIGVVWRMIDPGLVLKPYPLCSCAQAAVEALRAIVEGADLAPAEVRAIDCTVTPMVAATLCYDRPEDENQAMFSLPYALACILADRTVTPAQISAASLARRDLADLLPVVRYAADPQAFDTTVSPEAARVVVETVDGRRFEEQRLYGSGDPRSPLTDQAFRAKLESCLGTRFGAGRVAGIIETASAIEGLSNTRALTALLAEEDTACSNASP